MVLLPQPQPQNLCSFPLGAAALYQCLHLQAVYIYFFNYYYFCGGFGFFLWVYFYLVGFCVCFWGFLGCFFCRFIFVLSPRAAAQEVHPAAAHQGQAQVRAQAALGGESEPGVGVIAFSFAFL